MNNLLTKYPKIIINKVKIRATTPFIHSNKKPPFASIGINKFHLHTLPAQPPPPPPQTSHCLLFDSSYSDGFRGDYMLQHEDDESFENGVLVNPRFETFTLPDEIDYNLLIGSCNGLVLLAEGRYHFEPVHVCNPVTGEYVRLPENEKDISDDEVFSGLEIGEVFCGLGFDAVTNKYKVIRMLQYRACEHEYVTQICTLGEEEWTEEWTDPEICFYYLLPNPFGSQVFVNGALHWLTNRDNSIVALDVGQEKFQNFSRPRPPKPCHVLLKELGGYLCVMENFGDRAEIWVMKEYGVEDSWTKEWVIPLTGLERSPGQSVYPLMLMKNGSILLHVNTPDKAKLIFYDPVMETFCDLGISKGPFNIWGRVTAHAKSCVSLKDIVGRTYGNLELKNLEEWQLKSMDRPLHFQG